MFVVPGPSARRVREAQGMTDEFFLTPTDIAEALGCSRIAVLELIEQGELTYASGHGRRVAHSTIEAFVNRQRGAALTLGMQTDISPSFASSRPSNDK